MNFFSPCKLRVWHLASWGISDILTKAKFHFKAFKTLTLSTEADFFRVECEDYEIIILWLSLWEISIINILLQIY